MKLVHPELERQIEWLEHKECEWIIESPVLFATFLQELRGQAMGLEGQFVLSDENTVFDMSKDVEIIVDPLNLAINDKKILSKIYVELRKIAYGEDLYLKTQQLVNDIRHYFYELEYESPMMLDIDDEIDIQLIFKALGVKIEERECDFFENIIIYIKLLAEILKKKVVVLVNVRSYLTEKQIDELLECATYNEIRILLLESQQRTCNSRLKQYIIDSMSCEI